jgi:hypothetical protein
MNSASLSSDDTAALQNAVRLLENPGFAARLAAMVGKPVNAIGQALPASASQAIASATEKGLQLALMAALRTLRQNDARGPSTNLHKAAAVASGALGGAFGLATLPLELPVSTVIMLRSIAAIAMSEGEDLAQPEAALSCIQVFALGAPAESGSVPDSGYFAVRTMLAKTVAEAARFIAERSIVEEGAPVLVRFIAHVASRFGVVVTQKVAAQALPVVGALGGAAVNYAFIEHFQQMAHGHFTVRRLERTYGEAVIRIEYERLAGAR